jgi:hypothetical protein
LTAAPSNTHSFPVPRLRKLNGATELAVAEAVAVSRTRPEAVTAILGTLLESIGDRPVCPEAVRALPGGTREWLLQWSACRLNPEIHWYEARCEHCGESYDLTLDLSNAVCVAPEDQPLQVTLETSIGRRSFSVPTGDHEERFARLPDVSDSRRAFAALCGLSADAEADAAQFDEHDLQLIDEALEAASPDVADTVHATCPACGEDTANRIDPLLFAFPLEAEILRDIHLIAGAYGWRPHEILALPARHRARYADMIARGRRAATLGDGRR